jgi:hypothetical protein
VGVGAGGALLLALGLTVILGACQWFIWSRRSFAHYPGPADLVQLPITESTAITAYIDAADEIETL